ncbi:hypothetical protein P148_SR1C00001G0603 [candidate division SR1 bacterium RAAC1_SR1_1]|nr:hypothetical protein P148_SR1C00001G0603 [candidate division SR1 bacterium RAAC1_SR1_1]
MNKNKTYRLGNQSKEYRLSEDFLGFVPEGFTNWDSWNDILGEKKYPCDLFLVKGEEKISFFLKTIIIKDAFPMSFFSEERAKDWNMFAICSLAGNKDEEFIIPLFPYE